MQSLHPDTVSRCATATPHYIRTSPKVATATAWQCQQTRCCVAAYIYTDRQTDNSLCVGHGCFKAPVFRICKNVIKQRCQDLCARDWGDDRKHELHSKWPNIENKIPLLTKVQNSGKIILFFLTQTQDYV